MFLCCFVLLFLQSSRLRVGLHVFVLAAGWLTCALTSLIVARGLGWLRRCGEFACSMLPQLASREFDAGRRFTREVRLLSRFARVFLRNQSLLTSSAPRVIRWLAKSQSNNDPRSAQQSTLLFIKQSAKT